MRGRLEVDAKDNFKLNDLTLSLGWNTSGRGNTASAEIDTRSLFQGQLSAGSKTSYPFEFTLPYGPASYHGELLNVDWRLKARADVPWAIDPKAEQDFILDVSEGGSGAYNPGPRFRTTSSRMAARNARAKITVAVIIIMTIIGLGATWFTAGQDFALPMLIFDLVFFVIAAFLLLRMLAKKSAQKALGSYGVRLDPSDPAPGDKFRAILSLQPGKTIKLNAVTWTIIGQEIVISGSGTNRNTYRKKVVVIEQAAQLGNDTVHAGESRKIITDLQLPSDTPYSFGAADNSLEWTLKLHVDIPRSPDLREEYPFAVLASENKDDEDYDTEWG